MRGRRGKRHATSGAKHLAVELVKLLLVEAIQIVAESLEHHGRGEIGPSEVLEIRWLGDEKFPAEARKLEWQRSLRTT